MERIKMTMDGNHAAAHVSYAFTEVAAIYPITPSTTMAEVTDEWAKEGRKNIFDNCVEVREMQSEAGMAGAMHGALVAGALSTTFTASQGLLLMIPNLYKMVGERLPGVVQVSARSIATHALSIFGDHSDIYACRQTGIAMLCESSVQEVMDLTPVAHLSAIESAIPFLNFFDGFRTSHEIQKVDTWDYETLKEMVDFEKIKQWRKQALNPEHPYEMGSAQNPDIFFQSRETCNRDYEKLPEIVQGYMDKINRKIGTKYQLFSYYGSRTAKQIIVAMGSVCETIKETIDVLKEMGEEVGLLQVYLYRPFSNRAFLEQIPRGVERLIVLDRTKEPGAPGEPLYLDVVAAMKNTRFASCQIYHGRYGLGSKETTPGQIYAVYKNETKEEFTIGITDDVTNLSLKEMSINTKAKEDNRDEKEAKKRFSCKFWGLGADGTVGANKNVVKIVGDHTNLYVQAYFSYDSKKSGGVTVSHLRFGDAPIRSAYEIQRADFVACHCSAYIFQYDMLKDLIDGGIFLLNCPWKKEELEKILPVDVKNYLAKHNIQFYIIDAGEIAEKLGLGKRVNTILQAAFFALTDFMDKDLAIDEMKKAVEKSYRNKGEEVIAMNFQAIEAGIGSFEKIDVPTEWLNAEKETKKVTLNLQQDSSMLKEKTDLSEAERNKLEFVNRIQIPVNAKKGDEIPVSELMPYGNGKMPSGTAAFEKRGVAFKIPVWEKEKCIQCNQCSYVCPHAVIRPMVFSAEEVVTAPLAVEYLECNGMPGYKFAICVSALDCTGCGNCVEVCPAPGKAIEMKKLQAHVESQRQFDYGKGVSQKEELKKKFKRNTVKGSQFYQPLLEFSGACGGCGETAYAKLVTQLFGERMFVANATGCSSIWGNSAPSAPYTANSNGKGPAWANSLFEDAAEFGFGMYLAQKAIRENVKREVENILSCQEFFTCYNEEQKKSGEAEGNIWQLMKDWINTYDEGEENQRATEELIKVLGPVKDERVRSILEKKDYMAKKSQWIFGGDGWAYDIGYGGLDHVIAQGEDVNILVFDTEVYSNTGGQMSKSTPLGSLAKFSSNGKTTAKKDLARMAMSYENVYVAQIAMGADKNQCVKAIWEAEAYHGPSLIIAYAPCINHGIKRGMKVTQEEEKLAVACGYWQLFRYVPAKDENESGHLYLDSKELDGKWDEFLAGENRYAALLRSDKERAEQLFDIASKNAQKKHEFLQKIEKLDENSR